MKKNSLFLLLFTCLIVTILNACSTDELPALDFKYSVEEGNPLKIYFTTSMLDSDEYGDLKLEWDLGDGTKSTAEEVSHTYKEQGDYKVSLTLTSSKVIYDKSETVKIIPVQIKLKDFDYHYEVGSTPLEIVFTAGGSVENGYIDYEWDFGFKTDVGNTVTVTFPELSKYTIKLTALVDNTDFSETIEKELDLNMMFDFTYKQDPKNPLRYLVEVHNNSNNHNNIDYTWKYGFGKKQTGESPFLEFDDFGKNYIELIPSINNVPLKSIIVKEFEIPAPIFKNLDFSYERTKPSFPLEIYFEGTGKAESDEGSNPYDYEIDYKWDFGLGNTADGVGATHKFNNTGMHTVKMTAIIKGTNEEVTKTKQVPITNDGLIDFECVTSAGNTIDRLLYRCAVKTSSLLQNPKYEWTITDSYGDELLFTAEDRFEITFPKLDLYSVKLVVRDDVLGGTGVATMDKELAVLTKPVIEDYTRLTACNSYDGPSGGSGITFYRGKGIVSELLNVWGRDGIGKDAKERINRDKVNIIVTNKNAENRSANGTFENGKDWYILKGWSVDPEIPIFGTSFGNGFCWNDFAYQCTPVDVDITANSTTEIIYEIIGRDATYRESSLKKIYKSTGTSCDEATYEKVQFPQLNPTYPPTPK